MILQKDLVDAFGEAGLLIMEVDQAQDLGLSHADTHLLCRVGLPIRADTAFTTFLDEQPRTGTPLRFRTRDGIQRVLTLGGVVRNPATRYFLDIDTGAVGLLSTAGEPRTEKVNSTVENFVEFLYRLRLRQQAVQGESDDDRAAYTAGLREELRELDPAAFDNPDAWWSVVLEALEKRDLIIETRLFREQRRAELAETPAETPSQESRRDDTGESAD